MFGHFLPLLQTEEDQSKGRQVVPMTKRERRKFLFLLVGTPTFFVVFTRALLFFG